MNILFKSYNTILENSGYNFIYTSKPFYKNRLIHANENIIINVHGGMSYSELTYADNNIITQNCS